MFDTIIVGGGSAGCVLAARLSEDPDRSVLLIEAGPAYPPDGYPADLSGPATAIEPHRTWGYLSTPGRTGHPVPAYAGRVLGGGSAINGGIARRARPNDFARWAAHGLPDWSWDLALERYKAIETSNLSDSRWHGHDGPWPIHQARPEDLAPIVRAFVDAAASTGLARIDDFNGAEQHGVGCEVKNLVDGVRCNVGMRYLTSDVRARPNLTIRPDTLVDAVEIEDGRAQAIRLTDGERIGGQEVIVSAGVYGSPAILLRSGVGPKAHLDGVGIPVVADLPVGERLQDQPMVTLAYTVKGEVPDGQKGASGIVWTRSTRAREGELDLQLSVSMQPDIDGRGAPTRALRIWACVVTPRGTGTVRLKGADPQMTPRIDYRLLAHDDDGARLREAVDLARRIIQLPPIATMIEEGQDAGSMSPTFESAEDLIKAGAMTFYHGVGTVPMGGDGDPGAVVDETGRVRGVAGLRVVDASIIPEAISVPIHLTVLILAERIADAIRAESRG